MSTLKDIITGRQDSKKYRKDNFGNSGERSGMTVVYTGRGKTGYERRNFDAQHNSERSIRDIITGKETTSFQNTQSNTEKGINSFLNSGNQMLNSVQNDFKYNEYREYENRYKDYNYEQLKKSYKSATDGREKEWILDKIKENSSSKELQDWYDTLSKEYDSRLQQNPDPKLSKEFEDKALEYEDLIKDKQHQETAQKNQKKDKLYSDYYKKYDYEQLKKESENDRLSDYEREWLKNATYEKASSDDLQTSYDNNEKTMKEIREQKKNVLEKQNKASSIEEKQSYISEASKLDEQYDSLYSKNETLKNQIDKKKYEEKKKAEYDDVIENNIKAKTIMQKYYNLQKYDEDLMKPTPVHTIQGFENNKGKSVQEAYNYAKKLSVEEREQIKNDFNSLENKDTLYKYYKREREEQETAEKNQILTDYSEEHPVLGSLASMGLNTYGSVEDTVKYAGAGIDKAFGGDGYINPNSTNVAKAQTIREKVSEDMDGLGKFFYNTTMSIGDNIARMPLLALPGGKAMSLALAGTSAGVSSANDVINSGGSLESALWTGAAAGTAEVVFEKIPLDNLIKLKNEGTEAVWKAVAEQMAVEGIEEGLTDITNAITDQIINGDMSQLALQYQNYIAQGYSEEEARKQIAFDFASQLGQSFAAGAISGGVMSGGTVAINKIGGTIEEKSEKRKSASQLGREVLQSKDFNVNELIKSAKKSDNPKAVNLANSLEKVVDEKGADKVKAVDVGNLLTLTNSDEITYDYSQDLSELTGTDKQDIIDSKFELNGEEKTTKTSDRKVKYTDTKAFGENYPHGLGAKISKTGELITIVGLKSSSKDFKADDNTVVLLADNGELYDSDDIRTSVTYYNNLFDYAKNFDTIGARVFLSQYEDYVKRSKAIGNKADIAEYSKCFERLYSYGVKGVTYDSIKKSGNFTREINILSAGVAYSAVQSGNNDFKVDTRDKSNKSQKIRMPGESNSINSKVYVYPGSEGSVKVTDEQLAVLQAVANKTGREIILTDRMGERTGDENANGGYNLSDGKIYINAEVHDSYMLSVSLHEAVHGVAADNPAEYHALCTFITNYLVAKGENIDNLLDDIKIKWGDSARSEDAALEELVCQTVMAIATDEAAIKTALSLEENKGILQKVASALKKIAKAAYDFIKGVGIQAKPWIDDINALNELAKRLEKAFESTRKLNEQRANATANTETAQKNNTQKGVRFSVGKTFAEQLEDIKNNKHNPRYDLYVSETPKVLKDLNFTDGPLLMRNGKVSEILNKHSEMNYEILKQIPESVKNPLLILVSKTHPEESVVEITEMQTNKGNVVVPIWINQEGNYLDSNIGDVVLNTNFIASAYGRNVKGLIEFAIENDGFLYVSRDKRKVGQLFARNGLQLPTPLKLSNSRIKIPQNNDNVKIKYSYGGPTAKTANNSLFVQAIEMESSGKNSEAIRKKTGWFRGMDGKWRFEIDDSKMRFYKATKQDINNIEEYKNNKIRYNGLSPKILNNTATAEQQQKFKASEKYIKEYETLKKLSDFVYHPELFKSYPQLKEVNFYFDTISAKGAFYPDSNAIVINPTLSQAEQRESVIHEIQHAIQHIEGFADGSTMAQWQKNGADSFTAYNNYINTAGEIEARDTASRINLNSEQRKNTRPDIDRKDVVFAESDNKFSVEGVKFSIRLSDSDLNDYLKAGNRKNKIKLDQIAEGKSIILTNENDIIDYIDDSISGNKKEEIKAYGKVNKQLVSEILKETSKSVNVSNYYLELPSDNLFHAYREHSRAKKINNISLSKEDFEKIPEYFDRYDELLYVRKYASGVTSVCVGKNISSGKILIIETISKSRGALQFKNAFGLNEEGYIEFLKSHGLKNKISSPSSRGSDNSNTMSLPNGTAYNSTLSQIKSSVNNNSMQSNKNNTNELLNENQIKLKDEGKMLSDLRKKNILDSNTSEIKLAVDDTISDGMFADGDLFDEDGYIQQSVFERAVKDNPDFALTAVYNHAAKTAETAIKQSSDVKLDDKAYLLAAHRLMTRYDISRKLNKGFDEELAQTIRKHTERMERGVADFAGELELLVDDCKNALMLSGKLDGEALKTEREEILGFLSGRTLVITNYAESDVKWEYDTIRRYQNKMFGKVNVALERNNPQGKIIYMDDVVAFVEERFPHLITDEADDIQGFKWLDNLVNNVLKPKFVNNYVNGFYENIDTAAIEMAFDVTTEIINAKAKYAVADSKTERKYIRKIAIAKEQAAAEQRALLKAKVESYSDKAKEERSKRIDMIENLRRRMSEITDKNDKQRLKYEAQIEHLKTSLDKKTIIRNMGYETIRDQYNENRTKTVYREKLGRMLDRMTKKLDGKANNNEYIPEVLKKPILDVLSSFTADPGTYKNGNKKALPGYYGEWKNIAKIGDRVNELTNAYESLKSKEDSKEKKYSFIDVNSIAFREGTLEVLKYLSENLNGKNIYDLTADDLIDIYEAMQELDNSLRSAVEIILDEHKMSVQEAAKRAITETESVKYKKDVTRFNSTLANVVAGSYRTLKNKLLATQLDPKRFGRVLTGYHDDYVISQVMSELHEGDKKRTRIMQECFVKVQAVTSRYSKSEIKGLQRNDVTEFNFKEQKTGKRVKVSQGMLLAIYLTDRQADGHRHLVNENYNHYTVIPDLDMINLGRDGMNKSHKVRFSEADLRAIKQYVENNKILSELAGAISEVYNTILNQYINEVSMAKYGKLIATVKNYYPLWVYSDGAHYEKNFEAEFNDIRMRSRSFTKQRTRSYDPIVINDVLKTFTKSVQSASEYCGLLIPIENFKRVYNSGNGDVTLHEAIKEKFGESAEHYIEKLVADLQNAPEILDNTWLQKAQGNFMGAKLLFNPGAAIKQLAAFPTAFNYFGVKNVTAAAAVGMAKIDFDLYAKYTPYLWYRKNGNGTVIGELSREMGFYRKWNERADIMGKMDRYVVGCLLYAAELHVEQTTDLKRGTDAFYKEVVRQFEKCVDETQPNNMITSKPQFIRNNIMKLLSLNAFKSQNMAIANSVIDSFGEFAARKAEYKESKTEEAKAAKNEAAKKFAGSVIGAVCSSALIGILTVAVNLFIWHKWDDFKDEEGNVTPLTILQNFGNYALESLAGCFVWSDKAYEAIKARIGLGKFFGFEVMSVETLNDAISNLTKGKFLEFSANIVDMFGFPMENLLRIARSISSYANDIWNGNGEIITENNSLRWENNTSYFNFIIVEAKQNGETEKAEHFEQLWKDDLINKQGKTEKQANDIIKKKLVTALAVSDDDVEQAALTKANGDLSSYEEHMNKVVAYGFDSVDVKKAVDKVIKNVADDVKNRGLEEKNDIIADLKNQGFNDNGAEYVYKSIQSGESSESEEEFSAFSDTSEGEGVAYTYSDAFEYLKNGDRENYERIEQYLIDNNDKTKKDVQSAMRSASRTDKLWKEYFEAQGTLSGGGDPVKLEEYKKILTNIYGSWSTAVTYGRRYQKRMKKKENK